MRGNWFCKYKLAHRGLHNNEFPENSLGAFENACKQGFAIELDVRLLKDDTVVVFHDHNIFRMCGVDRDLNDITLDELKEYKLNKSNYTIPTLSEVLELINCRTPIMIELKPVHNRKTLDKAVYNIIKEYNGDIAVKSFNPFSMLWYKKHAPKILRGMLSSFFNEKENYLPFFYRIPIKGLWLFNSIKPDFISYNINDLPNKYIKNKSVPILAWTITSKEEEEKALMFASNVIFQNYIPDSPINY